MRQDKNIAKEGSMQLVTRGPHPKTITFGKPRPRKKFSHDDLIKLKMTLNMSGKQTKLLAGGLRVVLGRDAIEPNLMDYIKEVNHRLAGFFKLEDLCITKKVNKVDTVVHRPGVFCKDVAGLIKLLIEVRDIDPENESIQVGFDDGGGIVKEMMLIVDKSKDYDMSPTKRAKYIEGIAAKQFKNTSVKKLIMIGCALETGESYDKVKKMLDETCMDGVEQALSCVDVKMMLILIGKAGGSGSTYNCPVGNGKSPWTGEDKCELITLGHARSENDRFQADGSPLADQKDYENFTRPPLLIGENHILLILLSSLPGLHMMTGVVSKLIAEIEATLGDTGRNFVDKYLKQISVHRSEYHGLYSFEGNQARKLLKKIGGMMDNARRLPRKVKSRVKEIIGVMEAFDLVVERCFGVHLNGDYEEAIRDFSVKYRALKISVIPKVHMVEDHVVQSIQMKHPGLGLGAFTEQSFESCHHDFKVEWDRTKVDIDHPDVGQVLLDTVVR